jgi:hypothetical protein
VSTGKLYSLNDEQFVANVNYQLYDRSPTNLWGELTIKEYRPVRDGGEYVVELEDRCKCQCYLKKRVNRAVSGVPPRYIYHFSGSPLISPLSST